MPGLDMMPRQNPDDHEAAMARADLYKLANYSMKLFKMIQDGDQLEGWVQAKITKAADYVASVYHFMEYEMKFSEYGEKLETSDMYTEEVKNQFKAKLIEAKTKLAKLSRVLEGGSKPDYIDIDKDGDKKEPMKQAAKNKTAWPGTKEYKAKHGTEKERHQAKYGKDDELEKEYADRKKKGGYGKLGPSGSDTEEEPAKTKPGRGRKKSNENIELMKQPPSDPLKYPGHAKFASLYADTEAQIKELEAVLQSASIKNSKLAQVFKSTTNTYQKNKSREGSDAEYLQTLQVIADTYKLPYRSKSNETAISNPVASKTDIPATARTSVPGKRATQLDLKKANSSAALGEAKPSAGMTKGEKSAVVKKAKSKRQTMSESRINRNW